MIKVLLYLWQLPQNLLGLIIIKVLRTIHCVTEDYYFSKKFRFAISLGKYIIFSGYYPSDFSLAHERGHQKQSLYLGPLYLIIVVLPALIRNIFSYLFLRNRWVYDTYLRWYYSGYPENWANKLSGVQYD